VQRKNLPIGTIDYETDPFLFGRVPYPFACGIYFNDDDHIALWEPNIIDKTVETLRSMPPCYLYAHNGGKFDFQYLVEYANPGEIQIRNGRIMEMNIGKVTLIDSWPLMPFPLAEYQKTKIDYRRFEKEKRRKHKQEIISYMMDDCRDLLKLITGFKTIVGNKDTIGSAAFLQMQELGIEIPHTNEAHDEIFRPYFFGGRCEAFNKGIYCGKFRYFDINSAYPFAMSFNHASGADYIRRNNLPKRYENTFVHLVAASSGALPLRADDGSLSFPIGTFEFFATGWEIQAGLNSKTLKICEIIDVWIPQNLITFDSYVNKFFALKAEAKASGDKIHYLAYKYLCNSGYGKFAQNPRDFKEYYLAPYGENVEGWEWETDFGALSLWSKPSYDGFGFYDVSTAASITGFVRAMLWRAICKSKRVLYCDTDSLICEHSNVPLGDKLGEWKIEAKHIDMCAIGGKKLYALHSKQPEFDGEPRRIVSKGARLTWHEILDVCNGKAVTWHNEAPTFSIVQGAHFIERLIQST
jgi:hypothetical protein